MRAVVVAIVWLAASTTWAADECKPLLAELEASKDALRHCLRMGRPCRDEFKRREDAGTAALPCAKAPEPAAVVEPDAPIVPRNTFRKPAETRVVPREIPVGPTAPLFLDASMFLGSKTLDNDDWGVLDSQLEGGALVTIGHRLWPIYGAIDVLSSSGSERSLEGSTREIAFGLRRTYRHGWRIPQFGGGLSLVSARWEQESRDGTRRSGSGSSIGVWAGGSALLRLGKYGNLGVHFRWSGASVHVGDRNVGAGGIHLGVTAGFGAGAAAFRP